MSRTHFVQYCIQWSSIALVYYDYALTFPLEVKHIWQSRFRFSTILYICCRYALIANVIYLLAIAGLIDGCNVWYKVVGFLSVAGRASVLTIFTARTWAVWARSKPILVSLGSIALACVAMDLWHASEETCPGTPPRISPTVDEVLSVLVCAFELIATILTAIRCIMALWSQTHRERRFTKNIMFFMFREGLVYFGLVFGFTCAAAVLNFVVNAKMSHEHHHHWHPDSTLIVNQFLGKLLNAFTLPLSSLLSARLLLDLREWNERQRIMVSQDDHAWHFPSSEYNLNGPSKGSGKQPSSRRSPRSGGLGIESARVPGSANCASGRSAGSARSVRYGDSLGPWEVARREDVGGVRAPVGAENIELDDLSARASSAFEDEFGKDPFETVHRLDDARWIDPETMISDIVEYQKDDSRDQASKEVQGADIPEVTVTHVDGPEVFATRRCDNGRHSPGGLSALLSALQVGSRASSPTGSRRRLSPSPTPSSREGEDEDRFRDVSMGQAV